MLRKYCGYFFKKCLSYFLGLSGDGIGLGPIWKWSDKSNFSYDNWEDGYPTNLYSNQVYQKMSFWIYYYEFKTQDLIAGPVCLHDRKREMEEC